MEQQNNYELAKEWLDEEERWIDFARNSFSLTDLLRNPEIMAAFQQVYMESFITDMSMLLGLSESDVDRLMSEHPNSANTD